MQLVFSVRMALSWGSRVYVAIDTLVGHWGDIDLRSCTVQFLLGTLSVAVHWDV